MVRSLRMIDSGLWRLRFMGLLLAKFGRWRSSHKGWFSFGAHFTKLLGGPPAVRKVVACAFDHAGAQGDDQCGVTARLSKLTSGSG